MGTDLEVGWGEGQKGKTQSHVCMSTYTRTYVHAHTCMCDKMHSCRHAHMRIYTHTDTLMERILAITNQEVHTYVYLGCAVNMSGKCGPYHHTINDVLIPNDILENGCGIC